MAPIDFDLSFAVEARKTLIYRRRSFENVYELVLNPLAQRLTILASTNPTELMCTNSLAFDATYNLTPEFAEVDVVQADGRTLLYLGQVASAPFAKREWSLLGKTSDALTTERLQQHGPLDIIRDNRGYLVPVEDYIITPTACARGVSKLLKLICPPLAHLPITWLPDNKVIALYQMIQDTALAQTEPFNPQDLERGGEEESW